MKLFILHNSKKHSNAGMVPLVRARTRGPEDKGCCLQPLVRNGSFKTTTVITDNNNTQGHTRTIQEDSLNKLSRGIILVIIWTCKVTFFSLAKEIKRILGGANGKEPTCQCRRLEMGVQSLSREDPLEEGMASHSSALAWRILACYSLWGHKESDATEAT